MYVLYYHYPLLKNNRPISQALFLGVFERESDANNYYSSLSKILDNIETIKQISKGKLTLECVKKNHFYVDKLGPDVKALVGSTLSQEIMDQMIEDDNACQITNELLKESIDYLLSNALKQGKPNIINKLVSVCDINYDWILNSGHLMTIKDHLATKSYDFLETLFYKALIYEFNVETLNLFINEFNILFECHEFALGLVDSMLFDELNVLHTWKPLNKSFEYALSKKKKVGANNTKDLDWNLIIKILAYYGASYRQLLIHYKKVKDCCSATILDITWGDIANYAAAGGNIPVLTKIKKNGDINKKVIKYYLAHCSNVNQTGIDLLFNENTIIDDYLLNKNVNIEIIQYLIDKGCELNNKKYLEHLIKRYKGREEIVLEILNTFLEEEIDLKKLDAWYEDIIFV